MILKNAPPKLNKKGMLNIPVLKIPINITLKSDKYIASLNEYRYKTVKTTVLARPNFNPGIIPLNKGITLSTKLNTIERARSIDNRVIFFSSIILLIKT